MIAQEAKYLTQCMVTLYNKAREVTASDGHEVDFDLEDLVPVQDSSPTSVVQVVILDGAAIANMFQPDFADFLIYDPSVPAVHHNCEQTICVG